MSGERRWSSRKPLTIGVLCMHDGGGWRRADSSDAALLPLPPPPGFMRFDLAIPIVMGCLRARARVWCAVPGVGLRWLRHEARQAGTAPAALATVCGWSRRRPGVSGPEVVSRAGAGRELGYSPAAESRYFRSGPIQS